MKKLFLLIVVLVCLAGVKGPAQAEEEKIAAAEILTAIDVAVLMESGSSDEEISKLLSRQRGFDRESALKKGKTDRQIIKDLITDPADKGTPVDANKLLLHKIQGDKDYRDAKYDKAAIEYTLAIMHSQDNHELYKLRGDSYKQYFMTRLSAASGVDAAKSPQTPLDRKRALLCCAITSDYTKAMKINSDNIHKNTLVLKVCCDEIANKTQTDEVTKEVVPTRKRAGGNIKRMLQMRELNNVLRVAKQDDINLKKAIDEHKVYCQGENAFCQE
jgi:hypothetical protein